MGVPVEQVERIPTGNLRATRAEFAAVWAAAQSRTREQGERGVQDWYAAGVVTTCRWLAGASHRTSWGLVQPAVAPVTRSRTTAYEELIEAECLAVELLPLRQPGLITDRPGWREGIRATLWWAWRGEGPPPLDVPRQADTD
ncbi:hypothetical protein FRP1_16630 [Pseudonocardia sp. EC080625-04]|uniref:hypothetical protein n=1 Tax=Pseudonocardia sp. EC080625-04 TaxID=1096868 RepID=UPI0006CB5B6A|nr:hypothetical protein [Pseudonocardia sp. EC080625-04]ALE74225.1 hypothetical protein FRP1_16630 [Pseudonocardia sp. EC080625-04]